jgi:hypothetical protein
MQRDIGFWRKLERPVAAGPHGRLMPRSATYASSGRGLREPIAVSFFATLRRRRPPMKKAFLKGNAHD